MRQKKIFSIKECTILKINDLSAREDISLSDVIDLALDNYYRIYCKINNITPTINNDKDWFDNYWDTYKRDKK